MNQVAIDRNIIFNRIYDNALNNEYINQNTSMNLKLAFKNIEDDNFRINNYIAQKNFTLDETDTDKTEINNGTDSINYYINQLKLNCYDAIGQSFSAFTNIYLIYIYKRFYGDFISNLSDIQIQGETASNIAIISGTTFYKITFSSGNYLVYFNYRNGIAYTFSTGTPVTNFDISYRSNQSRKEIEVIAKVKLQEFNYTNNPSAFKDGDDLLYLDSLTAGDKVYVTTIGFYNEDNELIMVAKTGRPIPKEEIDLTFKVHADIM